MHIHASRQNIHPGSQYIGSRAQALPWGERVMSDSFLCNWQRLHVFLKYCESGRRALYRENVGNKYRRPECEKGEPAELAKCDARECGREHAYKGRCHKEPQVHTQNERTVVYNDLREERAWGGFRLRRSRHYNSRLNEPASSTAAASNPRWRPSQTW